MKKSTGKNRERTRAKGSSKRRGLWKGSISFGLVNIPVYLESAQQDDKIHFHLLDRHDNSPVGYKKINKSTGKEVSTSSIVKGYEYEKNKFVFLSEADFKNANVKATGAIDIEDFVEIEEIDPVYFERPYYIVPQSGGEKGYVLLREALKKSGKAGVAKIVLHTIQHLVIILPRENYLLLEIVRFANEIKEVHELDLLNSVAQHTKVSPRELAIAEQLVAGMTSKWEPDKYHDTYHEDLMKLIKFKIKHGTTKKLNQVKEASEDDSKSNVIDLTALLKKSLNATKSRSLRNVHGA